MSPSLSLALTIAPAAFSALGLIVLLMVWRRVRALARPLAAIERHLQALERAPETQGSERPASLESPGPRPTHRVDRAELNVPAGPTLISIPSLATPPAAGPTAASTEFPRRFGAIWALAESGATPAAIARKTGQPIGHVELILGLRRQLAADAKPRGGRS